MLRACRDCGLFRGFNSVRGSVSIECGGYPPPEAPVENIREYLSRVVCGAFEPRGVLPATSELLTQVERAYGGALGAAIARWFAGPPNDVTVADGRAWVSVSESNLNSFEADAELKSYDKSNHMFADLLGPVKLATPFIAYLSRDNDPGANLVYVPKSKIAIVSLGPQYSLAEITAAISYVLGRQKKVAKSDYFREILLAHNLSPDDPSFANIQAQKD